MKYRTIISLILLPQLAPALGAVVTIPNNDASLQKRNIKGSLANKLSHVGDEKAKVLKVAGQGIKVAGKGVQVVGKGAKVAGNGVKVVGGKGVKAAGQGVKVVGQEVRKVEGELQKTFTLQPEAEGGWEELDNVLPACAPFDCKKNNYFMNEATRWIKQALKDTGEVVHEHPAATAALVIGVSVLLVELISGGMLVPLVLRAIGFGVKGPIRNTLAAAVQRAINPVKLGSKFAQLQSAAMGGAALGKLRNIAHIAITALIGTGVTGIIDGAKPHDHSTHRHEWRTWELESRIDGLSNATQYWGAPRYGGCVAYGYCEARASMLSIPEDMDPLAACAITPALIEGISYKTPLGCVDEGHGKGVVGMWYVPTNATQCTPRWGKFEDEGCMLYGRRRKFARLMGLKNNGDWKGICESTPAIIDDKLYDGPSHCDDKGVRGIYGVFDIEDEQCECSCIRS